MLLDVLKDTVVDTLKVIPFLFLTYLLMEYLEHKAGGKTEAVMKKSGKFGPLLGGIVGIIPQCGLSAAAASLFAGGVISAGTLLAVFLSTSDEMLPIFISESVAPLTVIKILGTKALLGAISGFVIDLIWKKTGQKSQIHDLCEHDHCHCEENSIVKSAGVHTLQITFFIFVISFIIGLAVELVGADKIGVMISSRPIAGVFFFEVLR